MVGDCYEELPNLKDESINIALLDPPWGIGIQQKVESGILVGEGYEDSEEEFLKKFPILCKLMYQKMAEDSHLYCFFAIVHHDFVYNSLEQAGFDVNRRPIVVIKENVRSTQVPGRWPPAYYEPVAFARKGTRRINKPGAPDYIMARWPTEAEKLGHVSAKPPEVYAEFLRRSAYPGDVVIDPMYGSGSAFVGCEFCVDLRLRWFGWELSEEHKARALLKLTEFIMKGDTGTDND